MALQGTETLQDERNSENTGEDAKFTHIALTKPTQKRIALLAKVRGGTIYEMVGEWADRYWQQAQEAGLVTEAMLQPSAHWVEPSEPAKKKRGPRLGRDF